MGSGKHRWRISFHKALPPRGNKKKQTEPPKEFICPISGSLMADPAIVSSGQTFERSCVQACKSLGFVPAVPDDESMPDFSTVIPNLALKSTILNWCDRCSVHRPQPLDRVSAEKLVRTLMGIPSRIEKGEDLLERVAVEKKSSGPKLAHAATELTRRRAHFCHSSEESVDTVASATPLQLATMPSSYSSSSSSSEIEITNPCPASSEEGGIAAKLRSPQVFEQEEALISLRKMTRTREEIRVSICTPRLLSSLRSLVVSRYVAVQVNAAAALVNLSLEKGNKVKIVRSGIVPPLIDVLTGGFREAQEHAAGALFSLALDDNNKTAIGVLGALPPLLHALRSGTERSRQDSALALYHLSLVQTNRVKLVKLGAVPTLLGLIRSGQMPGRVLLVLCNLAACADGRAALLDGGAVECLVGVLRGAESGSESTRDPCVSALYALSHGGLRFKGIAKEAGVAEALRAAVEAAPGSSERAKAKARRVLEMIKEEEVEEEEAAVDWEELLELRSTSRLGPGVSGLVAKSTVF